MKNKKAMSHVEMIISFIIFIGFISFLLVVFNPLKIASPSSSYLDVTENRILKNVSTNLTIISMKINSSIYGSIGNCFSINKTEDTGEIITENNKSEIINSKISEDKILIEKSGDFYRLYFSEEFENTNSGGLTGCYVLQEDEYLLGVSRFYEVISNISLSNLFKDYDENYLQLKETLGLKNDFYISVKESSKNSAAILSPKEEKYKPTGVNVLARDIPISILFKDGSIKAAIMNLQVWD